MIKIKHLTIYLPKTFDGSDVMEVMEGVKLPLFNSSLANNF